MPPEDPVRKRWQQLPTSRRRFGRILVGLLIAVPRIAMAQHSTVVRRIGVLLPGVPETAEEIRKRMEALRELGWVEGRNLHVERRYASDRLEQLQPLAEELVLSKVEVIVPIGFSATLAAKRATTTVPIVFVAAFDPVGSGLVTNLARPGGNVTGFSIAGPEVAAKYLTVLKELLPALKRFGVVGLPTPLWRATRERYEQTCQSLGIEPIFVEIDAADEIDSAIAQLVRQRAGAVVLRGDGFVYEHRLDMVAAAMKHGLPTMAEDGEIVREAGALLSYSMTRAEEDRRVASYIDRILRGAKPGDLPVEQPTRFELAINLKTAKLLGLTIPTSLLLRADQLIE